MIHLSKSVALGSAVAAICLYGALLPLAARADAQTDISVGIQHIAGSLGAFELPFFTSLRTDSTGSDVHGPLRVLVVPGHEPDFGGTNFGDVYERDLTAELGNDLAAFLTGDPAFQAYISRSTKAWTSMFAQYFKDERQAIIAWEREARKSAVSLATVGENASTPRVIHNTAPVDVALRLYGITKWANENGIDLMIHIHFNDYAGRRYLTPGTYSGFVIYVPDRQYANGSTTQGVADAVYKRLSLYNPTSNLPEESSGVIGDSALIAVGANNTSEAASMLIEYGYIYEPQFLNAKVRPIALRDLAYQTYLGLRDFMSNATRSTFGPFPVAPSAPVYDPTRVYAWQGPTVDRRSDPREIYALQTALSMAGYYPPEGKTKTDCPHTGVFGSCTKTALAAYQAAHGINDEKDIAGPKSFGALRAVYTANAPIPGR